MSKLYLINEYRYINRLFYTYMWYNTIVMEVYSMLISTEKIISITEANQNFTKVTKTANKYGDTIIFKRNKPAYVLFDIEKMGPEFTEAYEALKLKHISEQLLKEYDVAYKALAK